MNNTFIADVRVPDSKLAQAATERFEVDSANCARDFLRQHGIDEASIDLVWDAISLHTTPLTMDSATNPRPLGEP
jgi:hypothetical protein